MSPCPYPATITITPRAPPVVIMFGGLHIEMTALKSIGTLLKDSGWTGAHMEADIASTGTADSFLKASSITRTWQMHQITACNLEQASESSSHKLLERD